MVQQVIYFVIIHRVNVVYRAYIYISIAIALDESIFLVVLHFPMIHRLDLLAYEEGGGQK